MSVRIATISLSSSHKDNPIRRQRCGSNDERPQGREEPGPLVEIDGLSAEEGRGQTDQRQARRPRETLQEIQRRQEPATVPEGLMLLEDRPKCAGLVCAGRTGGRCC